MILEKANAVKNIFKLPRKLYFKLFFCVVLCYTDLEIDNTHLYYRITIIHTHNQICKYDTDDIIKKLSFDIPIPGSYKIIFKHTNSENNITYNFRTRRSYHENWVDDIPE